MSKVVRLVGPLALLVGMWFFLAPTQLGGPVAYVTTQGNSMAPRLDQGDLVVVRRAPSYEVGDVVAFDSAELNQTVLHRIIREDEGSFVTKGDNNSWLDSERPTADKVIGRMWIVIPGGGRILTTARPFLMPAVGVLGMITVIPLFIRRRARTDGSSRRSPARARPIRAAAFGTLGIGLAVSGLFVSVLLGVQSLRTPVPEQGKSAYEHRGRFAYEAPARDSLVYPDGRADTGEPIFLRLVDALTIRFSYSFDGVDAAQVEGKGHMAARLIDPSGWTRRIPLVGKTSLQEGKLDLSGILDLAALQRLVDRIALQTGVASNVQTIRLEPVVELGGRVAGKEIAERFAPSLDLMLEPLKIAAAPAADAATKDPFLTTLSGSISSPESAPAHTDIFGVSRATALQTSMFGAALSLSALAIFVARRSRRRRSLPEASRIEARYGADMVRVKSLDAWMDAAAELGTFEELRSIAESYQKPILHNIDGTVHRYLVEAGDMIFAFVLDEAGEWEPETENGSPPGAAGPAPPPPPPREEPAWRNDVTRARARNRPSEAAPEDLDDLSRHLPRQ